jgi:hypothetical protein
MRLKPLLLLLICSLSSSALCQAIDGVYRGTLGKQEIIAEIGPDPDKPRALTGHYFYRSHGVSISLKGVGAQDGSFLLSEYHARKNTGGQWNIKFQNDQVTGTFCKCDPQHASVGKALPIHLSRISSGPGETYTDLLLDFPLKASPEITASPGYAYVVVEDPRFHAALPRLTRFPDPAAMLRINKLLAAEMTKYRQEAADCAEGVDFNGKDWDVGTKIELFNRHLLTVSREGSIFCGGAHPDDYRAINTYDLDSASEISTEDLLSREMNVSAIQKLLGNSELSGKDAIHRLMAELYLRHAHPEDDCRDVISRNEDTHEPAFDTIQYLSSHGLVVQPSLPHVVYACAEPETITYEELRTLLRKGSQFFSLVGAALRTAKDHRKFTG